MTIENTMTATVTDAVTYVQTSTDLSVSTETDTATMFETMTDFVTMTDISTVIQPTTYVSTYLQTQTIDDVSYTIYYFEMTLISAQTMTVENYVTETMTAQVTLSHFAVMVLTLAMVLTTESSGGEMPEGHDGGCYDASSEVSTGRPCWKTYIHLGPLLTEEQSFRVINRFTNTRQPARSVPSNLTSNVGEHKTRNDVRGRIWTGWRTTHASERARRSSVHHSSLFPNSRPRGRAWKPPYPTVASQLLPGLKSYLNQSFASFLRCPNLS